MFFLAGCALIPNRQPPLSQEVRTQMGTIGVVSADFIPEAQFKDPPVDHSDATAKGAKIGAVVGGAIGTVGMIAGIATCPHSLGLGCLAIPFFALGGAAASFLVGGAAGAIIGYFQANGPMGEALAAEQVQADLRRALSDLKMQESLRDRFLQVAMDQTARGFVAVQDQRAGKPGEQLTYESLRSQGIDTVVELSVRNISVENSGGADPSLTLTMTVDVRLVKTLDGKKIYERSFTYETEKARFSEWLAADAKRFHHELDRAYQNVSERIVKEMFLA